MAYPATIDAIPPWVDGTTIVEAANHNLMGDTIETLQAKAGITGSAVATSTDKRLSVLEGAGALTASGATVFNAVMGGADTFQDLDLSGTVGSKVSLVFLEVKADSNFTYLCKPNGYGGVWARHLIADGGCCQINLDGANDYGYATVVTDAAGKIEHGCSSGAATVLVKVVAYI